MKTFPKSLTRKIFFPLLLVTLLIGCNEEKKEIENDRMELIPEPDKDIRLKQEAEEAQVKFMNDYIFIDTIQVKNVPLTDSTNFDNFSKTNKLTLEQTKLLSLSSVIKNKEVTNIYFNYRLNLSNNFITIVITYENGDSELMTVLINYNSRYEIIDFVQIAYDEVVENLLRTESEITKNNIIVSEKMYNNEAEEVTKTTYIIASDGKITRTT
jgi:hypothetical protein